MIIDQSRFGGIDAYMRDPDNPAVVNLGGAPPRSGRTPDLGEGLQLDVNGIWLTLQAEDLIALLARTSAQALTDGPLVSVRLVKEMFPGLFADPYRHRVHSVAGFEDFHRGTATNCRAMEVDGVPTLVSVGTGEVAWRSPVYVVPAAVRFSSAAWDIASTRLTPADGFTYSLGLVVWDDAGNAGDEDAARVVPLVTDAAPGDPRFVADLSGQFTDEEADAPATVSAYRVDFTASVRRDALLSERHVALLAESLGRPLLRAVHLLEPIESVYDFASLGELLRHCSEYYIPEVVDGVATHMTAMLDFTAALVRGTGRSEYVEVAVHHDGFETFEAMLDASVLVRPPKP